jgi:8-oxo-dGTP pyrophosphatase MutT (NUDIX family)
MPAVIEAAILAAIHERLDAALAPSPLRYRPLVVGDVALGWIDDLRADRLARFGTNVFRVEASAVRIAAGLRGCASRSAALADVALALRAEGALPAWRDELYAVAARFRGAPAFVLERGAARYFGVRTWAAHVNGLVHGESPCMWLARRSHTKAVDPGLLDNLVGGGIAADQDVGQTVVKEAFEEAGIGAALARQARPAGAVHVRRPMADGLQQETIFVHDLWLPVGFVPENQDGEAIEHRLVDPAEAARLIAQQDGGDETTVDASLVVLDYLIRSGVVVPDQPRFVELEALRYRGGV